MGIGLWVGTALAQPPQIHEDLLKGSHFTGSERPVAPSGRRDIITAFHFGPLTHSNSSMEKRGCSLELSELPSGTILASFLFGTHRVVVTENKLKELVSRVLKIPLSPEWWSDLANARKDSAVIQRLAQKSQYQARPTEPSSVRMETLRARVFDTYLAHYTDYWWGVMTGSQPEAGVSRENSPLDQRFKELICRAAFFYQQPNAEPEKDTELLSLLAGLDVHAETEYWRRRTDRSSCRCYNPSQGALGYYSAKQELNYRNRPARVGTDDVIGAAFAIDCRMVCSRTGGYAVEGRPGRRITGDE